MKCYYHNVQDAVGQCVDCKKGLCRECCDLKSSASKDLFCYDCLVEAGKQGLADLEALKAKAKREQKWMIAGAIVGAVIVGPILGAGIGGVGGFIIGWLFGVFGTASLGTIINQFQDYGAFIGAVSILVCPIITVVRFFKRRNLVRDAAIAQEEDARLLLRLKENMEQIA
ncbi:MAG: hypothetical protein FWD06_07375 [Oscillospiraceae bacterium]|nr:hypothetical protein [Oscillospiraceae bacterium]